MKRLIVLAVAAGVLVLALAACSSGKAPVTSADGGSPRPTAPPTYEAPSRYVPPPTSSGITWAEFETFIPGSFPPAQWDDACVVRHIEAYYASVAEFQADVNGAGSANVVAKTGITGCWIGS